MANHYTPCSSLPLTLYLSLVVLEESKLFGEVPDAPVAFSATPYSTQISLHWDPPANGSTPISHYLLTYGEEIATEVLVINSDVTQYTLSNLKPGSDYVISLRAANEFGSSEVLSTVATTKNTSDPSSKSSLHGYHLSQHALFSLTTRTHRHVLLVFHLGFISA